MKAVKLIKASIIASIAFASTSFADIYICNYSDLDKVDVAFALPEYVDNKPYVISKGWYRTGPKGECKKIATLTGRELSYVGVFGLMTTRTENGQRKASIWGGTTAEFNQVDNLCIHARKNEFSFKHELNNGELVDNACPAGALKSKAPFGVVSTPESKDLYFYFTNESVFPGSINKKILVRVSN